MIDEASVPRADVIKTENLAKMLPITAKIDDSDIHEKHLWIGGVNVSKLPKTTASPLYIMDEEHIRTRLSEYRDGMAAAFPESRVCYATKAFGCFAMTHIVEEEGCWMLVCSGGELAAALAAGFPAERICMHGNNKSEEEIVEALMAGIGRFIIDNVGEIAKLDINADLFDAKPEVLVRVNPGIEAETHSYIQTANEDSKFGINIATGEALEAIKAVLEADNLVLKGITTHIGSQIFDLEPFAKQAEATIGFCAKVREETGFTATEIDLGGGLGIAYTSEDEPASIADYTACIGKAVRDACEAHDFPLPLVSVQPGRSIVGNAGVTCYRAGVIKEIPGVRTYVSVDGGMSDNIRTALYGSKYEAMVANKGYFPRITTATICGKHCESGDILIKDAKIQPVEEGDVICVFATGAYCFSMASNYNSVPRPGVAFVRDGKYRIVVRPQTYEDLMQYEVEE